MQYKTRMLVAETDLALGSSYHAKGSKFSASQADADYLVGKKKAREESVPVVLQEVASLPVAVEPVIVETVKRGRGRPPKQLSEPDDDAAVGDTFDGPVAER